MFVANIGDAKAVVARSSATNNLENESNDSNPLKAIVLTREHKAIYPQERARIQKVREFCLILIWKCLIGLNFHQSPCYLSQPNLKKLKFLLSSGATCTMDTLCWLYYNNSIMKQQEKLYHHLIITHKHATTFRRVVLWVRTDDSKGDLRFLGLLEIVNLRRFSFTE